MKTFARICGIIGVICWTMLCISAAVGHMTIEPIDYCFATGLLAFNCLFTAIRGE